MTAQRLRSRLARVLTTAAVTTLVASLAIASTALADPPGGSKLSKQDRERLATATANGSANVTMLFATVEGSTGSVANALAALGATVRRQDADVGYIRADVPTDKADVAAKSMPNSKRCAISMRISFASAIQRFPAVSPATT